MLDVIICEDNKNFKLRTYDIINQYLMNTNIEYKIKSYESYTKELKNYVKKKKDGYTVYILDIKLENDDSGIDIANDIREDDYDSVIILETGTELINEAQKLRLNILDYVHKSINYDKYILEDIEKSLKIFNLRKNIKFSIEKVDYTIKYEDVILIQMDSVERVCKLKTTNKEYEVKKPLNYFEKQLNLKFYKMNRGLIINTENIKKIDYNKNRIQFIDNTKLNGLITITNKKGLKEIVGSSK